MASIVDICNLALAHFGDEGGVSSISPPDGSAQAGHCARFYPIARDALLEMHAWDFATRRVALSQTINTPAGSWGFEYHYPSSCARILAIQSPGAMDDTASEDYLIETAANGDKVILTDVEGAVARYTKLVTDPTKFSPLFVTSLSWLLGSYVAGPITKDRGVVDGLYKRFLVEFAKASASNANAHKNAPTHRPTWLAAR